jgi:hypothetical protein
MTWAKIDNYSKDSEYTNVNIQYTDTYNIFEDNGIKHFSYRTKIVDFIQYIDNMLGISTTTSNVFEMLNIYEDDVFLDDPIKSTAYDRFIKSIYYAMKTL